MEYYKGFRIYPDNTGYVNFNFHLIDAELMAGHGESIEDCQQQIDELLNN
jgi:hypothetical protein